jgi:hypothetical protein
MKYNILQELDSKVFAIAKGQLSAMTSGYFDGVVLRSYISEDAEAALFLGGQYTRVDFVDFIGKGARSLASKKFYVRNAFTNLGGCELALSRGIGHFSSGLPDELTTAEQTNQPGCVAFDIYRSSGGHFLRVFVSVVADESIHYLSPHLCESAAFYSGMALSNWEGYELR